MSDESTTTNDEVEAHSIGTTLIEDAKLEDAMEAHDEEPDVEAHSIGTTLIEDAKLENVLE